jgi:tRNA(Ile)-lysidine synthase
MDKEHTNIVINDFEGRIIQALESILSEAGAPEALAGGKFLLAVSGGSDSVSMLMAMNRLALKHGWSLQAAHLNHGLRGQDSDEDERFTEDLCTKLGMECTTEKVKTAPPEGKPTQAWAREIRLAFLEDLAGGSGHNFIVTAHNADDQVETVLMRMLRGSGLRGLSGIPACRKNNQLYWIRPMLGIWRSEIIEYLNALNQGWREDLSNESRKYLRNEIRHDLVPVLQKIGGPGTKERILNLAGLFGTSYKIAREAVLSDAVEKAGNESEGLFSFSLASIKDKNDEQLDWLWHETLINTPLKKYETVPYPVGGNHCRAITKLVRHGKSGDRISLPDGLEARLEYGLLIIGEADQPLESYCLEITGPGEYILEAVGARLKIDEVTLEEPRDNTRSTEAFINPDSQPFPWKVRPRKEGDTIYPVRLNGHCKSVKELFIDCKIPRRKRPSIPLFEAGGGIFWIPDLEIDMNLKRCEAGRAVKAVLEYDQAVNNTL